MGKNKKGRPSGVVEPGRQVSGWIPADDYEILMAITKTEGRSLSNLLAKMVRDKIASYKNGRAMDERG